MEDFLVPALIVLGALLLVGCAFWAIWLLPWAMVAKLAITGATMVALGVLFGWATS